MRLGSVSVLAALLALTACDRRGQAESPTTGMPQPEDGLTAAPATSADRSPAVGDSLGDNLADTQAPSDAAAPQAEAEPEHLALVPEAPVHVAAPPSDYGQIKPTDGVPDSESLTTHGLAGYEVVTVYDRPDTSATSLGYLRIGTRLRVSDKVAGKGCRGTWHQLPQGGYACVGRGLVVDKKRPPVAHTPSTAPDKDAALPYGYAYVKRWNSPMYWRPPTATERAAATKQRARLEAEREGTAAPAVAKPATPEVKTGDALAELPNPDGSAPAESSAPEPTPVAPEPPPEPEIKLPLNPQTPWLERGFFVSIGEKIVHDGVEYWQTARGGFVEASAAPKHTPKLFEGHELPRGVEFPMGFVMTPKGAKRFEFDDDGRLRAGETFAHKTFVNLLEEVEHGGVDYVMTADGGLIRKAVIRFAEPQPLPEGLEEYDHWIDVSLDKQMLIAYEGTRPVFITLVSTGKKGSSEESFETPTGRWRIRSKHVSTTMDGGSASDGNYSIQDVPWTMYFHESFALHGAFWHNGFGRVRSHGCVNLGPADAKWLFEWSTPYVPKDWHGVHSHEGSPGTTIVVHH